MFPSMMRDFNDDFFTGPMESMRRMESMIDSMMSPFGGMFGSMGMHPAIQDRQHGRSRPNQNSLMPFGFGHSLFPNMDDMFNNLVEWTNVSQPLGHGPVPALGVNYPGALEAHMSQDGTCHSFSSSSVMTYTTDETGRPQVYQATSSTRTAPGGVKETRETLQDSRSGLQKMAIGHHLNDRAHVIEKKKNRYTGDEEENHEFVNLEDEEADNFDREWHDRAQAFQSRSHPAAVGYASRGWRERSPDPEILAITDGSQEAAGRSQPAYEAPIPAGTKKKGGILKRKAKRHHGKSHD